MNRDRYKFICLEAEAGRDAFVVHPASLEEGLVSSCVSPSEHLIVRTADGKKRCWDSRMRRIDTHERGMAQTLNLLLKERGTQVVAPLVPD